jgi:hypothetical protein
MVRGRVHSSSVLLLVLAALAGGCDSVFAPRNDLVLEESDIDVLDVAPNAPPLLRTEVKFWAVRGQSREVELRYAAAAGYSGKCLRFVVPGDALLRNANGAIIERGDSVEITIRVVDTKEFLFEFDPGGIRFDPAHPARLEIRYRWAVADLNGDGVVDATDENISRQLAIWRQERVGDDWVKIPSQRLEAIQEVHADITGFTRYALASDRHAVSSTDGI